MPLSSATDRRDVAAKAAVTRRTNTTTRHQRIRTRVAFWFDKKRVRIDDAITLVGGEFGLAESTIWRIYQSKEKQTPPTA